MSKEEVRSRLLRLEKTVHKITEILEHLQLNDQLLQELLKRHIEEEE